MNLALVKGASLIGVDIRQFSLQEAEASAGNMGLLFDLSVQGRLKVRPAKVYAFEQFAGALRDLLRRHDRRLEAARFTDPEIEGEDEDEAIETEAEVVESE